MTAAASSATARHPRRIAVVAVHGVANPEPGASARAVADLLLRRPEGAWREAEEVGLRIPIPGLPEAAAARVEPAPTLRVDERSRRFREALERNQSPERRAQAFDPSLEFALGLFEGYATPPPQTYSTPRIRLRNGELGGALEVDVIELYWTDLSRVGQGLVRFLGELYQLLLHLPSLGRHATDAESLRHPGDRLWAWFGALQAWAIRVLVLWVPVLNPSGGGSLRPDGGGPTGPARHRDVGRGRAACHRLRGPGLVGSARSLLDILLDVDNYMREHPRGAGPRVRMFERTHAVLQHLGAAAGGPSYDAVVFVAHSQGTVIVADHLRLARHRGWLAKAVLPVHLMTLGSPLRQLYERCFPALYDWVGREPLTDRLKQLHLASWTNLYRSGDYIGRALGFAPDGEGMREGCIGIGAHTHYWDETAPAVGEAFDRRLLELG